MGIKIGLIILALGLGLMMGSCFLKTVTAAYEIGKASCR